jgi:hypothetical protein
MPTGGDMGAILKTIRGERSLPVTYWLWFVIPAAAINITDIIFTDFLDRNPSYPVSESGVFWALIIGLLGLQIFVTYFIGYGVIQSAMKRVPKGIWGVLAIIIAVLGMVRLPFLYYEQLSPIWEPPDLSTAENVAVFQEQILREARLSLPQKVDDVTTLTAFTFEGTTLVYHYEVEAEPGTELNLEAFKTQRLVGLCEVLMNVKTPGVVEATKYEYTIGSTVSSMYVDDTDCDGR